MNYFQVEKEVQVQRTDFGHGEAKEWARIGNSTRHRHVCTQLRPTLRPHGL